MHRNPDELRRLHFINALFAQVTGRDLYLANQIKEAIAFSLAELEQQTEAHPDFARKYDAAFNAAAAKLLDRFFRQQSQHGFFHWDAAHSLASPTPLFARSEIMIGLKALAPYRESTLLITNLRPALLANRRNTDKRRQEYEEALAFIRELAASRTAPSAQLQLIFL